MDQNWQTLLHMQQADVAFAFTKRQQFLAYSDVMAAILKL